MAGPSSRWLFGVCFALGACTQTHLAPLQSAALPPPAEPVVRHSSRIWLDLSPGVYATQCVTPEAKRQLCFERVDTVFTTAVQRSLWPSFPEVAVLGSFDRPGPEDYVLRVGLQLEPQAPNAAGPGWSAVGRGHFELVRGGQALLGERLESHSRADFAYGSALAAGASEVVEAIAVHLASAVSGVPETHPFTPRPLPPVMAEPWRAETPARLSAAR